jgi:hypothetical protein
MSCHMIFFDSSLKQAALAALAASFESSLF